MATPDVVILERLTLLNEYVNDLSSLQDVDFRTYVENKLIRRTVERTLHTAMARFRNLIVHDYARIDNQVVFGILEKRLDDFSEYSSAILTYLESSQGDEETS